MTILQEIDRTNHSLRRDHAQHQPAAPILSVQGLTVAYPSGPALQDVSFDVARAQRLAVVGPNGAGKSTLIKVIAGVQGQSAGTVQVFGEEPDTHICIAYVPQRNQVDWSFPVSVREVAMMGRIGKLGLLRRPTRRDWQKVDQALEMVNLSNLRSRQISELSGGQQQRMFIARALAQEAELLLMDEPLTGLDAGSQEDILHMLDRLREQRVTVLVALHDLKLAADKFDAVLLLNHALIGFGAPAEVFTPTNLQHAYGSHRVSGTSDWFDVDDSCCGEGEHLHA